MSDVEFQPFQKIARYSRDCTVTEKLDGTNASIFIGEDGTFLTGSRTRWITPEMDNHGFSKWAHDHKEELLGLGVGHHFGEWWGGSIQRRYGIPDKRFSLFNTFRWLDPETPPPAICGVVPVLYQGLFTDGAIEECITRLRVQGSVAVPGCMKAEGIIIYHHAAKQYFKKTLEKDEKPKGSTEES